MAWIFPAGCCRQLFPAPTDLKRDRPLPCDLSLFLIPRARSRRYFYGLGTAKDMPGDVLLRSVGVVWPLAAVIR